VEAFGCDYQDVQYNKRRVVLGQIYHYRRGVTSRFHYSVGSSSSLGYGIKLAGSNASWSQGGTVTHWSDSVTSWRPRTGTTKTVYYTAYDYGLYWCNVAPLKFAWQVMPNGYSGGANAYRTSHRPSTPHCTIRNERGAQITVSRNRNTTWSNGVSLTSVIGIDVSSRSGYSNDVKMAFTFTIRGRKVCGSRDSPADVSDPTAPGWIAVHL